MGGGRGEGEKRREEGKMRERETWGGEGGQDMATESSLKQY
jgi:hypothetical protein